MITLYHCDAARSFRPLWMLEELSLTYEAQDAWFVRIGSDMIER